jgi:prepilin-type processing-associated H-X9-DG protein
LAKNDADGTPLWVKDFIASLNLEQRKVWTALLKCPLDKSGDITSYEFNSELSGKNLHDIPFERWSHTILIREKLAHGSHGYVLYLDGHTEKIHARRP